MTMRRNKNVWKTEKTYKNASSLETNEPESKRLNFSPDRDVFRSRREQWDPREKLQ